MVESEHSNPAVCFHGVRVSLSLSQQDLLTEAIARAQLSGFAILVQVHKAVINDEHGLASIACVDDHFICLELDLRHCAYQAGERSCRQITENWILADTVLQQHD